MVGSAVYTDEEILWILDQVLAKTKGADIESGFRRLFGRDIGHSQIRYVKNKYGKDPRFNSPLINRRTAAVPSPYSANTSRVGRPGMAHRQAQPRPPGLEHAPTPISSNPALPQSQAGFGQAGFGQAGFGQAGLGQAGLGRAGFGHAGFGHAGFGQAGLGQAGFFMPRTGIRRPRNDDIQPVGGQQGVERAYKRRRELALPSRRVTMPAAWGLQGRQEHDDRDGQEEEEEEHDEFHGIGQDHHVLGPAQELPFRRARRTLLPATAAPPVVPSTPIAVAPPASRPVSWASLSRISRGDPTPALWAAQAQRRAALGGSVPPAARESPAVMPSSLFRRGTRPPETPSSRSGAATIRGRPRAAVDSGRPAAERFHIPCSDPNLAFMPGGSTNARGDYRVLADRGPRRGSYGPIVVDPMTSEDDEDDGDEDGDDDDDDEEEGEDEDDGEADEEDFQPPSVPAHKSQILPVGAGRNPSYDYRPLKDRSSSAARTAQGIPYPQYGTLPAGSSTKSRKYDYSSLQSVRGCGESLHGPGDGLLVEAPVGADAAMAGNTRLRSRSGVTSARRSSGQAGTTAKNVYLQSSTSFRDEMASPGPGRGRGVTNLPNLNRPPGPGFAAGYYNPVLHQQETHPQGRQAGLIKSRDAMAPPPLPRRIDQSPRGASRREPQPGSQSIERSPELMSREWFQKHYAGENVENIISQFQDETEFRAFPFDEGPSTSQQQLEEAEEPPYNHSPQPPVERQSNQPVTEHLIQSPRQGTTSAPQHSVTLPRDVDDAPPVPPSDDPTWISDYELWGSDFKAASPAPQDLGLGSGTVAPEDSLLQLPSQGGLQPEQILPQAEAQATALAPGLFSDADVQQAGLFWQNAYQLNDVPVLNSSVVASGEPSFQNNGDPFSLLTDNDESFLDSSELFAAGDPFSLGDPFEMENLFDSVPSPLFPQVSEEKPSTKHQPTDQLDEPATK